MLYHSFADLEKVSSLCLSSDSIRCAVAFFADPEKVSFPFYLKMGFDVLQHVFGDLCDNTVWLFSGSPFHIVILCGLIGTRHQVDL